MQGDDTDSSSETSSVKLMESPGLPFPPGSSGPKDQYFRYLLLPSPGSHPYSPSKTGIVIQPFCRRVREG